MPKKYIVCWTELNHFESGVIADSPEEAQELAMSNLGEWQQHDFGGVEPNSIDIEFIEEIDV